MFKVFVMKERNTKIPSQYKKKILYFPFLKLNSSETSFIDTGIIFNEE